MSLVSLGFFSPEVPLFSFLFLRCLKSLRNRISSISFCFLLSPSSLIIFVFSHPIIHQFFTFQRSLHTETPSAPPFLFALFIRPSVVDLQTVLSPHVSSDFSLLPLFSFLLLLLSPPLLYRRRLERWEVSRHISHVIFCLPQHHLLHLPFLSPPPPATGVPVFFLLPSSFLDLFPNICLDLSRLVSLRCLVCVPVSLVPCLTLPFLPAVLSGVFQTLGAGQEPPGLARVSPHFVPIRSDTGTRNSDSSQQQLQED